MASSEGLRIALSPVQLAAVMSDSTVTEGETWSNRLMGGLGVAGGVVELIGAGVMCYAPDPTLLTKVGCVVVGTHSMDSIKAASNQIVTGQPTTTDTYKSAVSLAQTLGADENTAYNVGLAVDIAVPLVFATALGAVRAASVRVGQIRLLEHESIAGVKGGGHTIAKHVAKSPEELLGRLAKSPGLQTASTFTDLRTAEQVISRVLKFNNALIKRWAQQSASANVLELTYQAGKAIGFGYRQGSAIKLTSNSVRVVLLKKVYNGKPYYILTAYPIIR
ncbi:RNase A-like domain-containing protein [Serratia entomophila]|jgi:hypothetical protein|uniref:Bacterial CdiA-CT RNAse A domain-containing protein n=1 Tax=Serratia entomophila TaxID=42906 RepID=A0ABY5CRK9_9GAMM|nr:RNase A-like domain-containing protein [Serratia entomophila]UIW18478.1 hypothetical protein KHA73_00510 [Serratia entomophila]USV00748.1 hypothetical protein KFQ06_22480 [Serratia entomophila]